MAPNGGSLVDALSQLGLPVDGNQVPETPVDGFIAQWPGQRVLRLTGPGARKFLQGQLSCQIDQLGANHSLLAAACTPKGKALANLRLVALDPSADGDDSADILLRLSGDLEQPMLSHFQKYLAFYQAQMEAATDWCLLGLTGEKALQALGLEWNECINWVGKPGAVLPWRQSLLVASQPDSRGLPRIELWLNRADLPAFGNCLARVDEPRFLAPQAAWLAGEIQAGLTTINEPLRDRYVPQHFNWHAVDGISFRKGCYTGQEIIARMHYLGQLKKSTFRVSLPQGGTTVLAVITDDTGRAVGEITNLIDYSDGRQEALAIIKHSAISGGLQLADGPKHPLFVSSLPYDVPEQKATSG